ARRCRICFSPCCTSSPCRRNGSATARAPWRSDMRRGRIALVVVAGLAAPGAVPGAEGESLADAAMNRDMAAVRALLERGADPNALATYGTPALHWVVRVSDVATASLLLAAGADPNLMNAHGVAPLHLAIENGDRVMVERLLAAG